MPRTHRRKIYETSLHRIYGRQNVIVQRPFVIVHIMYVRTGLIQHFGQPQHIIRITGLRPLLARQHTGEILRRMEMLTYTVATDRDAAPLHHRLPKETCRIVPTLIALQVRYALVTDDFRDLGIGMLACQSVFMFQQRVENLTVRETASQLQIVVLSRQVGHIGKHLVQSPVFAAQHVLYLFVAQVFRQIHHPIGQLHQHVTRLLTSRQKVGIPQTGISLMDIVQRHPSSVQSERRSLDVSFRHSFPYFTSVRRATQVTVTGSVLGTFQFGQHVVQPLFDFFVPGGGIHIGKRRNVMPSDMTVQTCILPVGVIIGFRFQSCTFQIRRQKTVGIQPE